MHIKLQITASQCIYKAIKHDTLAEFEHMIFYF
jgi:hypothetical protein